MLTNLAPNHLDRYTSLDEYYGDKAQLFRGADSEIGLGHQCRRSGGAADDPAGGGEARPILDPEPGGRMV